MKVKREVRKLARIFKRLGATLYLVGGAVRNYYLYLSQPDLDITSVLKVEDFKDAIEKKGYKTAKINKTLGSVIITKNDVKMEYTSFRTEKYSRGHTPQTVSLYASLIEDSNRRDFTMDSLYYDILGREVVDPHKGIRDINRRIIRTVNKDTLYYDGLRLLRLARFAAELSFSIDKTTLIKAKENRSNVDDISKERIYTELVYINNSKEKYGIGNPYIGYKTLYDIGLIDKLFIKGKYSFKKDDLIYFKSEVKDYFSLLFYIIYRREAYKYGPIILKEFNVDSTTINSTEKTLILVDSIVEKTKILENIILYKEEFLNALEIAKLFNKKTSKDAEKTYGYLVKNNLLDKKCVNISVDELLKLGIPKNRLSDVLHKLHLFVAKNIENNTKEKLINKARRLK